MAPHNKKTHEIELSIIIISYNTARLTAQCIESVYHSMGSTDEKTYELIVLDNASHDDSLDHIGFIAKKHSNLKLILSPENGGFSKGNNEAVRHAKGKHLLFLNSDIIVLADAIPALLAYYHSHPAISFLGPKLLNADHTPQPSCGPFYSPLIVFGALFLKGDYWGLTRYSPDKPRRVDWVSGACILTLRSCFDELQGFDEHIFMYMEEIDLLYRAHKKNRLTFFFPDAHMIHLGSASSGTKSYPIVQVYRGFLYFYQKHHNAFFRLILRSMLQLKAVIVIFVGRITGNTQLIQTYEQALSMARMA